MRFRTEEEAETWVMDLSMRWILVRETRVVPSDDPPNYEIVKGDDGRFVCRFLTSPPPDSPSPEAA